MKTFVHGLIVIFSCFAALIIMTYVAPPESIKKFQQLCPLNLKGIKLPVMVIRTIDNSSLSKSLLQKCIYNQISEKEGVIFINRESEGMILSELARQGEIPVSENSLQPVGEILVPSHLLVINQTDQDIEISLSEVKSGAFVLRKEFQYLPTVELFKKNVFVVFNFLVFFSATIILSGLFHILLRPLFVRIEKQNDINKIDKDHKRALAYLKENKLYAASELMVKCARFSTPCQARSKAIAFLKNIHQLNKG